MTRASAFKFPAYLASVESPILGLALQVPEGWRVGEQHGEHPDSPQCGEPCIRDLSEVCDFHEPTYGAVLELLDLDIAGGAARLQAPVYAPASGSCIYPPMCRPGKW